MYTQAFYAGALRKCVMCDRTLTPIVPFYNPGIYAEGYIVFVIPFVCSSVRNFVLFMESL